MNKMGVIEFQGWDPIMGKPTTNTVSYPVYACGHCSAQIIMNPLRVRERKTCLHCGRWICDKNELCHAQCTPLYAMAADHFENAGSHGRLVNAIMSGVTRLDRVML